MLRTLHRWWSTRRIRVRRRGLITLGLIALIPLLVELPGASELNSPSAGVTPDLSTLGCPDGQLGKWHRNCGKTCLDCQEEVFDFLTPEELSTTTLIDSVGIGGVRQGYDFTPPESAPPQASFWFAKPYPTIPSDEAQQQPGTLRVIQGHYRHGGGCTCRTSADDVVYYGDLSELSEDSLIDAVLGCGWK